MDQRKITLAAMAAGMNRSFSPVQIQKLLFLIDAEAGKGIGGPFFNFVPYNYGPFDREVYDVLDNLACEGLVQTLGGKFETRRRYLLTSQGKSLGEQFLNSLEEPYREYIAKVAQFVVSRSFSELVSAIYSKYPRMRSKSVFRG